MDRYIIFIHDILPVLNIMAGLAIIIKIILVFRIRDFNVPNVLASFFKIYDGSERSTTTNPKRILFMNINNIINYYLYLWVIIVLLINIIY